MKTALTIFALTLLTSFYAFAKSSGGGGGAFVCRDQLGAITSAELLDLFEAREASGQAIVYDDVTPVDDQIAGAIARLTKIDSGFAGHVARVWDFIQTHQTFGSPKLVIDSPSDAYSKFQKAGCPLEGMMYFDDMRERLVIKKEIFQAQKTKTEVAASYVHEAIYRALREDESARDSVFARQITGCLFTADPATCLNLKKITLPKQGRIWKCNDGENAFYIYKASADQNYSYWKILFTKINGSAFGYETSTYGWRNAAVNTGASDAVIDPINGGGYIKIDPTKVTIAGLTNLPMSVRPSDRGILSIENADDASMLGRYYVVQPGGSIVLLTSEGHRYGLGRDSHERTAKSCQVIQKK